MNYWSFFRSLTRKKNFQYLSFNLVFAMLIGILFLFLPVKQSQAVFFINGNPMYYQCGNFLHIVLSANNDNCPTGMSSTTSYQSSMTIKANTQYSNLGAYTVKWGVASYFCPDHTTSPCTQNLWDNGGVHTGGLTGDNAAYTTLKSDVITPIAPYTGQACGVYQNDFGFYIYPNGQPNNILCGIYPLSVSDLGNTNNDASWCNTLADCKSAPTTFTISGTIYIDSNNDGIWDNGEGPAGAGITVSTNTGVSATTNGSGQFTLSDSSLTAGTYTLSVTPPGGYIAPRTISVTIGPDATNQNIGIVPTFSISGHIFTDYNHNGAEDGEDSPYTNSSVTISDGSTNTNTDAGGNFTFTNLLPGSYTITMTSVPAGYKSTTPLSVSKSVGPDQSVTFGITPLYAITGRIYNDFDSGRCYNPPGVSCTDDSVIPPVVHASGTDSLYTLSQTTVDITGNGVNKVLNQSNGLYDSTHALESGTYTVSLTTVPTNYQMTYPAGSIPPSFTVTVGNPGKSIPCNGNGYNDVTNPCTGDITNLDFGMNGDIPWHQVYCSNIRDENTTQNIMPNNPTCGAVSGNFTILGNAECTTGAYLSGTITPDFGAGGANSKNWIAGGAVPESFVPVNPGVIRTSSSYILTTLKDNGITPIDLSTVCTPTSCYLPDNLPSGVYAWPFDTTFMGTHDTSGNTDISGTYTFPAGKDYVFVVGNSSNTDSIIFKTKILVPNGSTATFISAKDIKVDPSIGENSITSTNADLEGFYSADQSFVIQSAFTASNRCNDNGSTKDLRFNLIGSVVANAALNGGSVNNQRDLCEGDLTCPVFSFGQSNGTATSNLGLTYILNAPDILKHKNFFWQELAP